MWGLMWLLFFITFRIVYGIPTQPGGLWDCCKRKKRIFYQPLPTLAFELWFWQLNSDSRIWNESLHDLQLLTKWDHSQSNPNSQNSTVEHPPIIEPRLFHLLQSITFNRHDFIILNLFQWACSHPSNIVSKETNANTPLTLQPTISYRTRKHGYRRALVYIFKLFEPVGNATGLHSSTLSATKALIQISVLPTQQFVSTEQIGEDWYFCSTWSHHYMTKCRPHA